MINPNENKIYIKEDDIPFETALLILLTEKEIITFDELMATKQVIAEMENDKLIEKMKNSKYLSLYYNLITK